MNKKHKSIIQMIILVVCITGFLACAAWIVYYFVSNHRTQQQAEDIRESYVSLEAVPTATPEPSVTQQNTPLPTPEVKRVMVDGKGYPDFNKLDVPKRSIDFQSMQAEENAHIYAWIYIPDTNVDYPILQHPDEADYYLNHDMKGNQATAGSIYTQYYNHKDFNDNHTVIYGHNMKNGSMFKTLHYYEDEAFFQENPYIYLYMESQTRVYQIFGAYEYSDVHLLLNFDTEDEKVYKEYLDTIKELSSSAGHFNWEAGVNSDDKIITLSTCIGNKPDKRYLVQAKLIAVEEVEAINE